MTIKKTAVHFQCDDDRDSAALALLLGGLLLFLALAFPHSEDRLGLHEELLETRYQAAELVEGWLVAGAAEKKEWEAGISRLLERNHLRPRFERWIQNPNYMKLVNETRRSASESNPVQPVFNAEAAKEALAR